VGNGRPSPDRQGGQDCDGALSTARPLSGHAPSARRQQVPPRSRWPTDQTQDTKVGRNAGQTPVRDGAKILTVVTGGYGAVALEFVDRTLDDIALSVAFRVESGWPTAAAAAAFAVLGLVVGLSVGSGMVAVIRRRRR